MSGRSDPGPRPSFCSSRATRSASVRAVAITQPLLRHASCSESHRLLRDSVGIDLAACDAQGQIVQPRTVLGELRDRLAEQPLAQDLEKLGAGAQLLPL